MAVAEDESVARLDSCNTSCTSSGVWVEEVGAPSAAASLGVARGDDDNDGTKRSMEGELPPWDGSVSAYSWLVLDRLAGVASAKCTCLFRFVREAGVDDGGSLLAVEAAAAFAASLVTVTTVDGGWEAVGVAGSMAEALY